MAITGPEVCFGAALPACPWRDDEPATLRAEHGFVRALYTLRAPELWRVTQPASGPSSTEHIRLDERDERTRGDARRGLVARRGERVFWRSSRGNFEWRDLDGPAEGVLADTADAGSILVAGSGEAALIRRAHETGSEQWSALRGRRVKLSGHDRVRTLSWSGRWVLGHGHQADVTDMHELPLRQQNFWLPSKALIAAALGREAYDDFIVVSSACDLVCITPSPLRVQTIASLPYRASILDARGDWVLLRREDPPVGGLLRVHAKTGAYAELPGVRAHAAALFDDGRVAYLSKGHAYVSDARGVCAWGSGATRITHTPAWSPDARRLAVTCADGTIRVLSRATIGLEWTFEGSRGPALFSADSRTLWSVDPDEGLFGWDLATGVEAVRDRSVRVYARSLIVSPDGRALLDPSSAMLLPLNPRDPPHDAAIAPHDLSPFAARRPSPCAS